MRHESRGTGPLPRTPTGPQPTIVLHKSPNCGYLPVQGEPIMGPCPVCRHLLALHVGEDECPVCRLVNSPAMRPDMLIESVRHMLTVLRPGEVLLVRVAPYLTQAQVEDYQRRVTRMMELAGLSNVALFLYGEEFAVMSASRELEAIERRMETGREQSTEGPEEIAAHSGGESLDGGSRAEAGSEETGEVPGSELPEVPAAEPGPAGDDQGRADEVQPGDRTEGLEEPAAGGEEPPDQEAAVPAEQDGPVREVTSRRRTPRR